MATTAGAWRTRPPSILAVWALEARKEPTIPRRSQLSSATSAWSRPSRLLHTDGGDNWAAASQQQPDVARVASAKRRQPVRQQVSLEWKSTIVWMTTTARALVNFDVPQSRRRSSRARLRFCSARMERILSFS